MKESIFGNKQFAVDIFKAIRFSKIFDCSIRVFCYFVAVSKFIHPIDYLFLVGSVSLPAIEKWPKNVQSLLLAVIHAMLKFKKNTCLNLDQRGHLQLLKLISIIPKTGSKVWPCKTIGCLVDK